MGNSVFSDIMRAMKNPLLIVLSLVAIVADFEDILGTVRFREQ